MPTVDWVTGVITVPVSDLTLVQSAPPIYEHDVDQFRLDLRDLEDDVDGRPWPKTHDHVTNLTLSGLTYARKVIILDPYTVTYEDGQYTVQTINADHNILDKKNPNQVSVITQNSAGKIETGSGLSPDQDTKITRIHEVLDVIEGSLGHDDIMRLLLAAAAGKLSGADGTNVKMRDLADAKDRIDAIVDEFGNRTSITLDAS